MNLTDTEKAKWVSYLDEAVLEAKEVEPLTDVHSDLSLADAYAIQNGGIAKRLERGESIIGYKMGLTSKAKMLQMGVEEPIYGTLTSSMGSLQGHKQGFINTKGLIHPKVEPEIAFVTKNDLRHGMSEHDIEAGIDYFCAALEVIDSRYRNFRFKLPDVIADNASSTFFLLGEEKLPLRRRNVENLGMIFAKNKEVIGLASSSAIFDSPFASLKMQLQLLGDQILPAGSVVLAGAATAATAVQPGDHLTLEVQGLGVLEATIQ